MVSLQLSRLAARRAVYTTRAARPVAEVQNRSIHRTSLLAYPRKDSQDKDSINTEATEYTKSGTDDDAARNEQAAFDPSTTQPGQEKNKAAEGNEQNPLDVSPANPDVSKQRSPQEGGAERSAGPKNVSGSQGSGHGSPEKGKKVGTQ